jgi:two-component system, cell cycle sensor histidine kinase and response regulator CckA
MNVLTAGKHAEAWLRMTLAKMPMLFWTADRELRIVAFEHSGLSSIAVLSDQVVGRSLYAFFRTEDVDALPIMAHHRALAGESVSFTNLWQGRMLQAHVDPLVDSEGRISGCIGMALDATEQGRVEAALVQSEQQFQSLIRSINAIVWEADATTFQFTFVSEQAERILGYPVAQWLQDPQFWANHIHPDDRTDAVGACVAATSDGENHEIEYRMIAADGRVVWLRDLVTVESTDGVLICLRGVMFDITERKRLEAQLLQAQKMESLGRLAGGIAHDFNNMLTGILGYAELLADGVERGLPVEAFCPGGDLLSDLREIQKAAQRATNLTRQLLTFAHKQVIAPRVLNLNDVILDVDKLLQRLIGDDIELITLPAPDLGQIKADAGQLEQVLINLVVNARDAMPQGGKLVIETANVVLDGSYIRQHAGVVPSAYVLLAVSDTGVGMDADAQAHLFEPFYTTKSKDKGTGLGLATCYGIVKQHGGSIQVYSEVGYGTTFKIYLPWINAADDTVLPPDGAHELPRGTETVLLVEDDCSVRSLATRVLQAQGYTVLEAADGDAALRMSQEHPTVAIHLLLTDVVLPQMAGQTLAKRLTAVHRGIKVLFTSGYTEHSLIHSGQLAPGLAFLQKPFLPSTLGHAVRAALDAEPADSRATIARLARIADSQLIGESADDDGN